VIADIGFSLQIGSVPQLSNDADFERIPISFDKIGTMSAAGELPHPDREDITLTGVLFALSDPDRLVIAQQLVDGPLDMAACSATDPTMPKSTRSHLMKVLREAGVIRNEPNGRRRILSLRRDDLEERFPGVLDTVLHAAGPAPAPLESDPA
jgi:DNA-binding transcriptional ArsR family regulator